jgi:hypothetical protein
MGNHHCHRNLLLYKCKMLGQELVRRPTIHKGLLTYYFLVP